MGNSIIIFLASFLIWIMFAGLFVLWIVDGKIKREEVIHALLAAGLAWSIAQIIKALFPTVRPFITDGTTPMVLLPATDGAFPSGHSAAAFALATSIFLHDKKVGIFYQFAALIIGIARILGNVHYPIDILGGALLGVMVAFITKRIHLSKLVP